MDARQKLDVLAESSKFDLSCACKRAEEPGRRRGIEGQWIYPAALPDGRRVFLLKTLQSNQCVNDCSYCPFNQYRDMNRCTLSPDQLAGVFDQLYQARLVEGLFLSSGVTGTPDQTMEKMLATVELVRRRYAFKGFIHLKVIPGASREAIEQAVKVATRVSVNIEAPTAQRMARLSQRKRFHEDIIDTMKAIREARLQYRPQCHMTTQFVVGAAGETDREIVLATHRLYEKIQLERVYFSAYQSPDRRDMCSSTLFQDDIVMAKGVREKTEPFMREHRLYQVDFLFRQYGFELGDIALNGEGQLDLKRDPKQIWADHHPHLFPVDINRADRWLLLRVPGIGPRSVRRILKYRKESKFRSLADLKQLGVRTGVAGAYLTLPAREPVGVESSLFGEL